MTPEDSQKRILILTADVGFGHRSAANAIAEAFEERYSDSCIIQVENPLDDERTPTVLRDAQDDYDRMVREDPEIYRLRYKLSDSTVPNALFEGAVTVMLYNIIHDIVQRVKPHAIVITHPMYPAPVSAVLAVKKLKIPVIIMVTDLVDVHIAWLHKSADLWLVPTREARERALEESLPGENVQVIGIPVRPAIARETRSPQEIRTDLGWDPDLPTVLVVGSKRVKHLDGVLNILNHSGFQFQMIVVTGGDDKLYAHLEKIEWHPRIHLYNYVKDMPSFLKAADCIITKAGGLIVTESLACGLPMLLVDVTPGQEQGNAEYVVGNGAGELADTPLKALETMCHWLEHGGKRLEEMQRKAASLGNPQSAYTIADLILSAAEREPKLSLSTRSPMLPKILDLLANAGISPNT